MRSVRGFLVLAALAACLLPEPELALASHREPLIYVGDGGTFECASPDGTELTLYAFGWDVDDGDVTLNWWVGNSVVQTEDFHNGYVESTLTYTFPPGQHFVFAEFVTSLYFFSYLIEVNVVDTTAPAVTVGDPVVLAIANRRTVDLDLSDLVSSVQDTCDGEIDPDAAGTILSISSDEPEDAGGSGGNTVGDIVLLGASSFRVRAERAGSGNGRVYTVTFQVADAAGNTAVATARVTVPHHPSGDPAVDDGAEAGYTVTP